MSPAVVLGQALTEAAGLAIFTPRDHPPMRWLVLLLISWPQQPRLRPGPGVPAPRPEDWPQSATHPSSCPCGQGRE
jgi:hypothetical protein